MYIENSIDFCNLFRYNKAKAGCGMILCPDYINALKPYIDAPLVKILSGVRRCGKSTILMMLADELRARGIASECIVERRYNEMEYDGFTEKEMYRDLMDTII